MKNWSRSFATCTRTTSRGQDWENSTLDRFLEALAAWTESSDGWYRNFGKDLPANGDWTFIARALSAATVYE